MNQNWERFLTAARLGTPDQVPVALIVDSPWLPGYVGIDTRDYFLYPDKWLQINLDLLKRFPDVVWIPGFWVEFGMAAEPSAFGCRMRFYPDRPPSIEPLVKDLAFWQDMEAVNPQEDGLMPLALRLYGQMDQRLQAEGLGIGMVAARGPLTTASWLTGITPLMEGMITNPDQVTNLLETVTTSLIRWLEAQLGTLRTPQGILLLDDLVGMVSKRTYLAMVEPHLKRILTIFPVCCASTTMTHPASTCWSRCRRLALTFSTSAMRPMSRWSNRRWVTGWRLWATWHRLVWAFAAHRSRIIWLPPNAWTKARLAAG